MIKEIEEDVRNHNDIDNSHVYFLNGYLSNLKRESNFYYPACPSDSCMKKVSEDQGGFRCENCNKTYPDFKPTYMVSAKISDFTNSIYVNFAREQGDFLMGK